MRPLATWDDDGMEPNRRENTLEALKILEAMVQAIDRREEVFTAIAAAQTQDEARDAVAKILGVGEIRAIAVLNMQARRWTQGERRKIVDHIEEIRSELESLKF